jgi:RNA-directed DNA polymerase
MSKALAEIASIPSLSAAWQRLFGQSRSRSRDGFGVDGESLNQFKEREQGNIKLLSFQVRKGEYAFSSLTAHLIPKPNGNGIRVICVPTVRDRIVQRAVVDYLTKHYMVSGKKTSKLMNPISFGFLKGRTVGEAVQKAAKYRNSAPWVYKTDITKFFDQIPRPELHRLIARHVTEKSLHDLLIAASECEIDESRRRTREALTKNGIRPGIGVRQGMPLSPIFANLLMVGFDRALNRAGARALRYADDLIFFASSRDECLKYHEFCKKELGKIGLTVPEIGGESKSQIFAPAETADFLGIGIARSGKSYFPVVTHAQFKKMREKFLTLGDVTQLASRKIRLATFGGVLDSTIEGYMSCYRFCHNYEEVDKQLMQFREMAIRNLLRDGLHVDVNSLKPEARIFLGLA